MLRLLQFIWHGCWHNWVPCGQPIDFYDISFGTRSFDHRSHPVRCSKCGRFSELKSMGAQPEAE